MSMALRMSGILRQKGQRLLLLPQQQNRRRNQILLILRNHIRHEKVHLLQRVMLAVRIPSSAVRLAQLLGGAALQRCDENQNDRAILAPEGLAFA
jgi:hypothetical protein